MDLAEPIQEKIDMHTIVHKDQLFTKQAIQRIESQKNAKYLGEFSLKDSKGNWYNNPVAVFYQSVAHPDGSNYFGLYYKGHDLYITDAESAALHEWNALEMPNMDVIYSAFRHDYQEYVTGDFVDGGAEYYRGSQPSNCRLRIVKDKIVVLKND